MAHTYLKSLLFFFVISLLFTQCSTSSNVSRATTLQSGLDADPKLSTFNSLVNTLGGIDKVLSNSSQKHTLFVPTNEAFDLLGQKLLDNLSLPDNHDVLKGILQSHITEGVHNAAELQKTPQALMSIFETPIDLANNSAQIVYSVKARNGMIHVIDKVIQR